MNKLNPWLVNDIKESVLGLAVMAVFESFILVLLCVITPMDFWPSAARGGLVLLGIIAVALVVRVLFEQAMRFEKILNEDQ